MNFTYRPLTPRFGVEVQGFDPAAPVSEAARQELYAALLRHRVLLFRNAPLTEEQQVNLTQVAGQVTVRGGGIYKDAEKRKSELVSNAHQDGLFGNGELSFHSDLSFTEHILKARSLHALILPADTEAGGQTLFSDVQDAYDDLDPELKVRLEPLRARFAATFDYGDHQTTYDHVRALVGTHPQTGRRFIAASRAVTKEVVGLEREVFRPLLKQIWGHMEQPQYVYRHTWRLGDTLLWDNIAVQHARTPFDPKEKRALRAVSVDDPSIAVAPSGRAAA